MMIVTSYGYEEIEEKLLSKNVMNVFSIYDILGEINEQ